MPRREDLLAKARANPKGLRFSELLSLAESLGWQFNRGKGSHRIYIKEGSRSPMTFQEGPNGKAMPYQVRQLLDSIED